LGPEKGLREAERLTRPTCVTRRGGIEGGPVSETTRERTNGSHLTPSKGKENRKKRLSSTKGKHHFYAKI